MFTGALYKSVNVRELFTTAKLLAAPVVPDSGAIENRSA